MQLDFLPIAAITGFYHFAALVAGLGMFLYGMHTLAGALRSAGGSRAHSLLLHLTNRRPTALLAGILLTVMTQSSSATTVLLISLVQARLLTLSQTLGVILGADVGTTITAQIIAFKDQAASAGLLLLGTGMLSMLARSSRRIRRAGQVMAALGMIFFGMTLMSDGIRPVSANPNVRQLVADSLENPLAGIAIATVLTAVIQSSAATAGIVLVLADEGLFGIEAAIPLIFGANIGTCVTAWLASLGATREAKQVALAHTLFKVLGVLLFVGWIPAFADLVVRFTDAISGPGSTARQIANAHTLFNVALAVFFLPFTPLCGRLVRLLVRPGPPSERDLVLQRLDESLLDTPSLALQRATKETRLMGEEVQQMVRGCIDLFQMPADEARRSIRQLDDHVDFLQNRLRDYLTAIGQQDLSNEQVRDLYVLFTACNELEHIGDAIKRSLFLLSDKMERHGWRFSDQGWAELSEYHANVCDNLTLVTQATTRGSDSLANEVISAKLDLTAQAERLKVRQFERIRDGVESSIETDEMHMELLDVLRQINSYAGKIARVIAGRHPPGAD
jgi:phosphate:Na+ symporter